MDSGYADSGSKDAAYRNAAKRNGIFETVTNIILLANRVSAKYIPGQHLSRINNRLSRADKQQNILATACTANNINFD